MSTNPKKQAQANALEDAIKRVTALITFFVVIGLVLLLAGCSSTPHKSPMERMDTPMERMDVPSPPDPFEVPAETAIAEYMHTTKLLQDCEREMKTPCVNIVISLRRLRAALKAYELQKRSI